MIMLFDHTPEYRSANSRTCLNAPFIRAVVIPAGKSHVTVQHIVIQRLSTLQWNDIYSLLYVLRWVQSLHGLLSIVSSLIALLPSEYPSLQLSHSLSLADTHTHIHTNAHTHTVAGPESGRAAAKGLTAAFWREVTALCITRWHWQLTDGYHSHTSTAGRGKWGGRGVCVMILLHCPLSAVQQHPVERASLVPTQSS